MINVTIRNGIRIVEILTENLDWGFAHQVESQLLAEEWAGKPAILDLSSVRFADSMGIGLLYRCAEHVLPSLFILTCVGYRLSRCLERMPAYRSLPVSESVESAFQVVQWQISASVSIETRRAHEKVAADDVDERAISGVQIEINDGGV
jgi:anti-anti-sigma regulatory factor